MATVDVNVHASRGDLIDQIYDLMGQIDDLEDKVIDLEEDRDEYKEKFEALASAVRDFRDEIRYIDVNDY